MAVHEAVKAGGPAGDSAGRAGHVLRHRLTDRLFHWVNAASILTLLVTAFGPVLGWKLDWVTIHWIAGIVLTLAVIFHIVRAILALDIWMMLPVKKDVRNAWQATQLVLGRIHHKPGKPDKYPLMQKLYHWGMAGWLLVLIGTGLVMLAKLDTPFWQRNPYFLSEFQWGVIYSIHGFFALGTVTLVMIHIYFAVRPDKIYLLRSMIVGWLTRAEQEDNYDGWD